MKYHGIFADNYRGHLAGMVGTRGAYGAVLRTRVTPVNPETPAQLAVRNFFKGTSSGFNLLTPAQMEAWRTLGSETKRTDSQGAKYKLTAINMYKSVNQPLLYAGELAIADPPSSLAVTPMTDFGIPEPITPATTTLDLEFGPDPLSATEKLVVDIVENVSAGISNVSSKYSRLAVSIAGKDSPLTVTINLTPIIGRRYWLQARILDISNGQYSAPLEASVVVTAVIP